MDNFAASVALDNHVILQEVFKFLSPGDLRICCEVDEKWGAIAGPMVFEYHIRVDFPEDVLESDESKVVITNGYLNPRIENRNFSPQAETEYLETLKRGNCFISLEICGTPRPAHEFEKIDFVTKFRARVYKITCSGYNYLNRFFREPSSSQDLHVLPYFPHCEEFCVSSLCSLALFSDMEVSTQLVHLRRVHLGKFQPLNNKNEWFPRNYSKFLKMVPNLKEVHGVPFAMINIFEKVEKVHLIRSVRYHGCVYREVQTEALKTLVQSGMKFKFLRIGMYSAERKGLLEKNMHYFDDLLETGKDTLEHLVILSKKTSKNNIKFPATMPALKHITFKKLFASSSINFPSDFDFSGHFPNLTTISFSPITLTEWKSGSSWWGSKEKPVSEEFSKGIRHLRCTRGLNRAVQQKILERFPFVKNIDYVDDVDETEMDCIVSD